MRQRCPVPNLPKLWRTSHLPFELNEPIVVLHGYVGRVALDGDGGFPWRSAVEAHKFRRRHPTNCSTGSSKTSMPAVEGGLRVAVSPRCRSASSASCPASPLPKIRRSARVQAAASCSPGMPSGPSPIYRAVRPRTGNPLGPPSGWGLSRGPSSPANPTFHGAICGANWCHSWTVEPLTLTAALGELHLTGYARTARAIPKPCAGSSNLPGGT
jgi:hypothetical protein